MLDRRYVLDHLEEVRRKTELRGAESFDFDGLVALVGRWKATQAAFEEARREQKVRSE